MADFETELTDAIDSGDVERVRQLLRDGHEANTPNAHGESPMAVAAMSNNVELLELLARHGGAVNGSDEGGWTPLHFAVDHSIDAAIQSGGKPGDERVEAVSWLLSKGADCDARTSDGATPRDIAADYKSKRVLDLIDSHLAAQ